MPRRSLLPGFSLLTLGLLGCRPDSCPEGYLTREVDGLLVCSRDGDAPRPRDTSEPGGDDSEAPQDSQPTEDVCVGFDGAVCGWVTGEAPAGVFMVVAVPAGSSRTEPTSFTTGDAARAWPWPYNLTFQTRGEEYFDLFVVVDSNWDGELELRVDESTPYVQNPLKVPGQGWVDDVDFTL